MFLKTLQMFLIFFLSSYLGRSQDCTLDIGGKNKEVLFQVFQMNENQKGQMEVWATELEIEIQVIEAEIQKLFSSHPQSTPEELTTLSKKYIVLKNKIIEASKATDTKLLSMFNEKQYKRYLVLCSEALLRPIQVVPVSMKEAIESQE